MFQPPNVPVTDRVAAPLLNICACLCSAVLYFKVKTAVDILEAVRLCGVHSFRLFAYLDKTIHQFSNLLCAQLALVEVIAAGVVGLHTVIAHRKTEVLPFSEKVCHLNTLSRAYLVKVAAEPASCQQGASLQVTSSALLFYENDLHALFLGFLHHVGDALDVFFLSGVCLVGIVDADGDYVVITALAVSLYSIELTCAEEALSILTAGSHISHDVACIFNVVTEELTPAVLTGVSHIIIVGYSRVAAYPYGGVRGGCGV